MWPNQGVTMVPKGAAVWYSKDRFFRQGIKINVLFSLLHICLVVQPVSVRGSLEEAGPLRTWHLTDSCVPAVGLWRKPSDRSALCSRGVQCSPNLQGHFGPQSPACGFPPCSLFGRPATTTTKTQHNNLHHPCKWNCCLQLETGFMQKEKNSYLWWWVQSPRKTFIQGTS